MGEVLLNGRPAKDWELAAVEHGHKCDRDRDLESLAGLLPCGRCGIHGHQAKDCMRQPAARPPVRVPRPLTDVTTGMLR